jgi:hypothetical protein
VKFPEGCQAEIVAVVSRQILVAVTFKDSVSMVIFDPFLHFDKLQELASIRFPAAGV